MYTCNVTHRSKVQLQAQVIAVWRNPRVKWYRLMESEWEEECVCLLCHRAIVPSIRYVHQLRTICTGITITKQTAWEAGRDEIEVYWLHLFERARSNPLCLLSLSFISATQSVNGWVQLTVKHSASVMECEPCAMSMANKKNERARVEYFDESERERNTHMKHTRAGQMFLLSPKRH